MSNLLCLGDSYTIGEAVSKRDSFPYQLVDQLQKNGLRFSEPEIIAQTGWTTHETMDAMRKHRFKDCYDWVTILSGVNNQYRGYPLDEYSLEFQHLLDWGLKLTGNRKKRLIVLSIPDWGYTPFAQNKNRKEISEQINQFNAVNRRQSMSGGFHYIDICPGTREAIHQPELIASDGLHPSSIEYSRWAQEISRIILEHTKGTA